MTARGKEPRCIVLLRASGVLPAVSPTMRAGAILPETAVR